MSNKKYTEEELVRFGLYLLSEHRHKMLAKPRKNGIPLKEKARLVFHADVENWKFQEENLDNNG